MCGWWLGLLTLGHVVAGAWGGSGADGSVLGKVQKSDSESMTTGAICSINDLPDVYTVLKACKHALMASCKSRR